MAENLSNDFATTLSGGIDASQTNVNVTSATGSPSANFRIRVDDELMLVTSKGSGTDWTVTRNIEGTSGASHSSGATVAHVITKAGIDQYLNERYARLTGAVLTTPTINDPTINDPSIDSPLFTGSWTFTDASNVFSLTGVGLPTGSTDHFHFDVSFTAHSGGGTSATTLSLSQVLNGSNDATLVNCLNLEAVHSGGGAVTNLTGARAFVHVQSTGSAINASAYDAPAPTFSSSGAITTARLYRTRNWGHATKVTNLHVFDCLDQTACATITAGFSSHMTSGTGKWGFYADGDANNAFLGNTRIGSTTAPTEALDVTGNIKASGDVIGALTIGTPLATTSGTTRDFTGLPSGIKRISINFDQVSTNGSSNLLVQLGDAGGFENTGYDSRANTIGVAGATSTAGFILTGTNGGGNQYTGRITLELVDASANTWVATSVTMDSGSGTTITSAGRKSLSAEFTQIRLTTVGGTDTFDNGQINISYER